MECSFKRKLDCIVDSMEVIATDNSQIFSHNLWVNESKKRKISDVTIDPEQFQMLKNESFSIKNTKDWLENQIEMERRPFFNNGDIIPLDNDLSSSLEDEMQEEDVPTTLEVINSLRKVILWMSAQVDYKSNHLHYLTEVEKYAMSKQLDIAQQRKITQYFLKD